MKLIKQNFNQCIYNNVSPIVNFQNISIVLMCFFFTTKDKVTLGSKIASYLGLAMHHLSCPKAVHWSDGLAVEGRVWGGVLGLWR